MEISNCHFVEWIENCKIFLKLNITSNKKKWSILHGATWMNLKIILINERKVTGFT